MIAQGPKPDSAPPPPLSLIVVEDQTLLQDALCFAVQEGLGHRVVGRTGCGREAVVMAINLKPDAIIMDLGLPDLDGLSVAEIIRERLPQIRILVMSGRLDAYTVFRVEHARVNGFVDKNSGPITALSSALDELARGGAYFSESYKIAQRNRKADPWSFDKLLSDTEQKILPLIGDGLSDEEIATHLAISTATAQKHRSHILRKLQVRNTPKLMAFARQAGFSKSPSM